MDAGTFSNILNTLVIGTIVMVAVSLGLLGYAGQTGSTKVSTIPFIISRIIR
jgi:hypothetical protein